MQEVVSLDDSFVKGLMSTNCRQVGVVDDDHYTPRDAISTNSVRDVFRLWYV